MKIPTLQQIKEIDAYTIAQEGIESIDLMERAARAVVKAIALRYDKSHPCVVFAGPGNNGGDALAIARLLAEAGYDVTAYLFNTADKLSADCKTNLEKAETCPRLRTYEIIKSFDPYPITPQSILIDGLFGVGLNRPLTGGFISLIDYINQLGLPIFAIDLPSGLFADGHFDSPSQPVIRATYTLSFQLPKSAFFLADTQPYLGKIELLDIGLNKQRIDTLETRMTTLERSTIAHLLHKRSPFAHKGSMGHALLVAGSHHMMGAAILAAQGCLRTGVGKVSVATPINGMQVLQSCVPEAVILPHTGTDYLTQAITTSSYQAVALGPGLGTQKETARAFIETLSNLQIPAVLDADALNILSQYKNWITQIPAGSILTPHPSEFARLQGRQNCDAAAIEAAVNMASNLSIYIILKGHYTAICTPEQHIFINTTGNSGMATAGCGDVLTGMLTSLLAQGYHPQDACRIGVYLHGLCGDIAAKELGEEALLASDLIKMLPQAFRSLKETTV